LRPPGDSLPCRFEGPLGCTELDTLDTLAEGSNNLRPSGLRGSPADVTGGIPRLTIFEASPNGGVHPPSFTARAKKPSCAPLAPFSPPTRELQRSASSRKAGGTGLTPQGTTSETILAAVAALQDDAGPFSRSVRRNPVRITTSARKRRPNPHRARLLPRRCSP